MGRIFLKGDVHGNFRPIIDFIEKFKLDQADWIIVLGDMGLFWRKDKADADAFIEYYEDNYIVNLMFIDGNHENFDLLNKIPEIDYDGSKIYEGNVSPHITYLPRGHSFQLYGKRFLCMGGADSIDKIFRTKHLSWWEQEKIIKEDIAKVDKNLEYDYVLTHCCPRSVFEQNKLFLCTLDNIGWESIEHDSEDRLEEMMDSLHFKKWYFAHYHVDLALDDKFQCLFNDFVEIADAGLEN